MASLARASTASTVLLLGLAAGGGPSEITQSRSSLDHPATIRVTSGCVSTANQPLRPRTERGDWSTAGYCSGVGDNCDVLTVDQRYEAAGGGVEPRNAHGE